MKIVLEGKEAENYIAYLSATLKPDKPETIKLSVETAIKTKRPSPTVAHQTQMMHDVQFSSDVVKPKQAHFKTKTEHKPHDYPEGVTRTSVQKPRWSKLDLNVLQFRIDPLTGAAASERTLENVLLKLPERTESAIRCKILNLGGCVTNGVICKQD